MRAVAQRTVPDLQDATRSRVLGGVLIAEVSTGASGHRLEACVLPGHHHDLIALHLIMAGEMTLVRDGEMTRCGSGGLVVLDLSRSWSVASSAGLHCYTVLIGRRAMPIALPDGVGSSVLRIGPGTSALRRLFASLLAIEDHALDREQAYFSGQAVTHLLHAVLMPSTLGNGSAAPIREATLLDRATALIDAHLAEELDVAGLCTSLGCSRSALYRATAPVNGIAELIVRRRLAAVHRMLRDLHDQRSVAAIAQAAGFSDPSQFNRQFRRVFGTTPGRTRGGRRPERDEGEFNPLLSLITRFQP